jgi:hypothetical protein
MAEKTTPKLAVHISDYDLQNTLDLAVRAAIEEQVGKSIERFVSQQVGAFVETRVRQLVDEELAAAVKKSLTEGWSRTDDYGREREKLTLSSYVRTCLTKPDQYNRQTVVADQVEKSVREALAQEFGEVIKEAKATLRAQLDAGVMKALRFTVADALKGE